MEWVCRRFSTIADQRMHRSLAHGSTTFNRTLLHSDIRELTGQAQMMSATGLRIKYPNNNFSFTWIGVQVQSAAENP